jgi:hypothetical protein
VDHKLNAANTSSRSGYGTSVPVCLLADVTDCILVVLAVVEILLNVVVVVEKKKKK